jgi:hypothetical protein
MHLESGIPGKAPALVQLRVAGFHVLGWVDSSIALSLAIT